jgi:DNA-binding transcriptional LysR family regulator
MDLKRLSHIVAVAKARNFARAAEQVHLSQPALTRSIQAAEAELGLRLFDRGSEVTPTRAGAFVLERARQLLFESASLERDVDLFRRQKMGDTAFGAGSFPAGTFLAPLLAELRREFAGVNLRVEVSNCSLLLKRLLEEDIEFIVADTEELPHDKRLVIEALRREPAAFYVRKAHPLGGRRHLSLDQVWAYGVASGRLPASAVELFTRMLDRSSGAPPRLALECDDIDVLKRTALDSDVVLAMPSIAVQPEVDAGTLRQLTVKGLPPMSSATGIVTLRGRTPSPMAKVILERLRSLRVSEKASGG